MDNLSSEGWYRGIPDRTLLLHEDGLRLVYGDSMDDEIGVCSLDGWGLIGFFKAQQLVDLLQALERDG